MKKIVLIAIILTAAAFTINIKAQHGHFEHGTGYFYTSLAPHGTWIELNDGFVVWRPARVHNSWAPYMNGQWIWTSDGWYWDSYEPFGYITYHYGRWYYDDYYGWMWVPDNQWAPAWVEWRYDDNYIGWAPLPPYAGFSFSIGIDFSYNYHTPYHHWNFVNYNHFCDPYVNNYYLAPKYKKRIFHDTRYRADYGYERDRVINRGVDVDYVRKRAGHQIRQREIERVSSPDRVSTTSKNNDRVRAFIPSRDDLTREAGNVEIKRSERKSTLETSRVQVGGRANNRNSNSRTENGNNTRGEQQPYTRERANNNIGQTVENKRGDVQQERTTEVKSTRTQREVQPVPEKRKSQPKVERNSVPETKPVQNRGERQQRTESAPPVQREKQSEVNKESSNENAPHRNSSRSDNSRNSSGRSR